MSVQSKLSSPSITPSVFTELYGNKSLNLQLFKTILDQIGETVVVSDLQPRIIYVNSFIERHTGYKMEEVIGQNPGIFKSGLTPIDTYKDLWRTIKSGKIWQGELINKKKDGSLIYEQSTISPIRNSLGEVTHYVATKRDITQQIKDRSLIEKHILELERFKNATVDLTLEMKKLEEENKKLRLKKGS